MERNGCGRPRLAKVGENLGHLRTEKSPSLLSFVRPHLANRVMWAPLESGRRSLGGHPKISTPQDSVIHSSLRLGAVRKEEPRTSVSAPSLFGGAHVAAVTGEDRVLSEDAFELAEVRAIHHWDHRELADVAHGYLEGKIGIEKWETLRG